MPEPKTILEYATQRRDNAKTALTDAQKRLADAQAALIAATADSKKASAELADLERRINDIRQKLSGIVTPADGEVLLDALELATIRLRSKQAAVANGKGKFSMAQANVAQAQSDVAAASAVRTQAQTAVDQATVANEARDRIGHRQELGGHSVTCYSGEQKIESFDTAPRRALLDRTRSMILHIAIMRNYWAISNV